MSSKTTNRPIAVCISDIHFNLNNLELASRALIAALRAAEERSVPLIIAGDLQDTKAIIRGEVANTLIELIRDAGTDVYIIVGNHDLISEKGQDHTLNYLRPYARIIDKPTHIESFYLIPYQTSTDAFKQALEDVQDARAIICHQGFLGAFLGDYIQDKTSVDPSIIKGVPVISGHYHKHQTVGPVTYIGSPFTMSFGEANDGEKGYLLLNSDGSYTRKILNLRRHILITIDITTQELTRLSTVIPGDLVWIKLKGPQSELDKLSKDDIGQALLGHSMFKLDLIPSITTAPLDTENKDLTDIEILDKIIDIMDDTDTQKIYLKGLYREIIKD